MIIEAIRMVNILKTGIDFPINHDFNQLYARTAMFENEDLRGFFEDRGIKK
jgi:hypothetical protein